MSSLNLTHTSKVTYDNIKPKLYDADPVYAAAVAAKIAEMVASGKTDGVIVYGADDNVIYRNFTSEAAAYEWLEWVYAHNEPVDYPNVTHSIVTDYSPPTNQTPEHEAARRARILGNDA